jgi:hypothetical protein
VLIRCTESSEKGTICDRGSMGFPWFEAGKKYEMENIKRTHKYAFQADVKGVGRVTDLLRSCFDLPD